MAAATTFQQPSSHFSPPSHPATPSTRDIRSPRLHFDQPSASADAKMADMSDAMTPTNPDVGGMAGQKPLPTAPFSPANLAATPETDRSDTDREDGKRSVTSRDASHHDVEMGDDGDQDDSDNGSVTSDPQRLKKKKKGQRFFCTEYPPCNLSFTRSEHLARHVRKHTGERPFQCHCGRRFSRLDNLRQHAQTVHVNEEIPADSPAATGTRFQRQIRTDRVRAPGGRARAGTASSIVGHARGHSRNLSSSSIASNVSNISALPDDPRRRPPPLAMAQDHTPRRVMAETYAMPGPPPAGPYGAYYPPPHSPGGYSSPTSTTFSTGGNSPRFPMQSPTAAPRAAYFPPPPNARRLSVPAASSPYQQYPPAYYNAAPPTGPYHSSTSSTNSIASPRGSLYTHSRRESDAELEWRRRTWHPSTYSSHVQRPATSGLMYQQTPDDARPTTSGQAAATQVTRLPGIESFDHALAAANRSSSPMRVDEAGRPPVYAGPSDTGAPGPDHRRSSSMWESSLHQNLNRLDLSNNTPPRPAPAPPAMEPTTRGHHMGADSSVIASRRQGWYGGPLNRSQPISISDRASPVDSASSDGVPTPSTSHGREAHPAIMHHGGMVEVRPPGVVMPEEQQMTISPYEKTTCALVAKASPTLCKAPGGMGRLEALVAVATSEDAHR
ncbi:hypothetical protein ANO11243_035720 [Dothideomycetidae sp. 11243]|nr:hypothetical protein ANO11243_035720 [fungal sp. No.11243]